MKKTEKLVSTALLLSGLFVGYIQAAPYVVATEMHSVE